MKKSLIILVASSLVVFMSIIQRAQDPKFLVHLKEKLSDYLDTYPEEKLYVQTDKPFYAPGDDIWFNVTVLNSTDHKPSMVSDVVYVDLIDPRGNVTKSLSLLIKEGSAHGDFHIDKSDEGGPYKIRAYTQWMKNFGEDRFFSKHLPVQRVITPRLLLELDFEKEAYGPADTVVAEIKGEDLQSLPLQRADIRYKAFLQGALSHESGLKMQEDGTAQISLILPTALTSTDGLLNVIVSHNGLEESISRSIPIVLNDINLTFFPEGGDAIQGVESRMAFKAMNEFNKGADVAGVIVDEDGRSIQRFESFHMGMGAFKWKPEVGKKYFARINRPAGDHELVPLPTPQSSGISLHLAEQSDDQLTWQIHSHAIEEAYLVGTTHGSITYTQVVKLKEGVNSVTVNTRDFPIGIAVFTLFDHNEKEQAERLVFLNQGKGLNIDLQTNKSVYAPRELVKVTIKTTDKDGKPVRAKLSLAAVDDQLISFADDKQDHLLSHMLLSSEVKGEIQEPQFYFDPEEKDAAQAMDILLMTQGWRRFSWKDVQKPQLRLSHRAERLTDLSGVVRDRDGIPMEAEVTLMEMGGEKRIVTLQTTPTGNFVFRNIDPQQIILLVTKNPGVIYTEKKKVKGGLSKGNDNLIFDQKAQKVAIPVENDTDPIGLTAPSAEVNLSLSPEVTSLGEVVVVGYGTEERSNMASSITRISYSDEDLVSANLSAMLQGRVPGIQVSNQTGIAGTAAQVRLRGLNSMTLGNNSPLLIIDGFPVDFANEEGFASGNMVAPADIETINVLSPSAATSALYGSRGSNGVIVVETRSRSYYSGSKPAKKPNKYYGHIVNPRKFSGTRVYYSPPPSKDEFSSREDFRKTVYWNHQIVTNHKGKAEVSFYNNDAVSAFRLTAEGFTAKGELGRAENTFSTLRPVSLDVRFPQYLGYEDALQLPVWLSNETSKAVNGNLELVLPEALQQEGPKQQKIQIEAGSSQVVYLKVRPVGITGAFPVSLRFNSASYRDEVKHTFIVRPVGFPRSFGFSGNSLEQADSILLNDVETNSLQAHLRAYPMVLNDLFEGADAILREPHGCFEQVSSSNYPNILALQFMRATGQVNPKLEKRALWYLRKGYDKLISYEVKGGGFDWFGRPPASEGLTAFGLVQFEEMKKVMGGVSESMINRIQKWLMSRKDGRGGFKGSSYRYRHGKAVSDAYIVFALSQTGVRDIEYEYSHSLSEALESRDLYRMALMALTAHNLGKSADYAQLMAHFKQAMKTSDFDHLKASHSIVWGYGRGLRVELASLWTLALLKEPQPDLRLVHEAIEYLTSKRRSGRFGSTQATALALQALTEFAKLLSNQREPGEIELLVNGTKVTSLNYTAEDQETLSSPNFATDLQQGQKQKLKVQFKGTDQALPYSVDLSWYTKTPPSSEKARLKIKTKLASEEVKMNETVRLTTQLENVTDQELNMPMAIIGLPAGLSPQPWQLKELNEQAAFDFYELINGRLVLYFRNMKASEVKTIHLDLKAEIPGQYIAPASSAYLYYFDEYKHFVAGEKVEITMSKN